MDATKLIEEAEMLSAVASAAPWRCEHGREIKSGAVSLAGVLYEQDRDFIIGARTLVPDLAAALKASEEQNKATTISLRCAEASLKAATAETEPAKSANLAANKRIVELEHERDEAHQQLREIAESYNAECSAGGEPPPALTCMLLALKQIRDQKQQMRDGFNYLIAERDAARAELARLTTPRPIAEAPRDGTWIGAVWEDMTPEECARFGLIAVVRWSGTHWEDSDGDGYEPPSHYVPLPEVKP